MPVFNNALAGAAGSGGAADYKIERSLRFNDSDSAHLTKTFSAGNSQKWTWAAWVKRNKLGGYQTLFGHVSGASGQHYIDFGGDKIRFTRYVSSNEAALETSAVYRDTSAWMHVCAIWDVGNSTANHRQRLFVNGVEVTEFSTRTNPSQNYTGGVISTAIEHHIGKVLSQNYGAFQLADVQFLDGTVAGIATDDANGSTTGVPNAAYLTDFGEFDADTGVWNPIEYTGSYSGPAVGSGVVYSDGVSSPQGIQSAYPATNAFDGSTSTACTNVTTNGSPTLTVTFNPPLTNVTSLRMYTGNIGSNQYATGYGLVNGTSISHSTLGASYGVGWVDFTGHFSGTTVNSMGLGQTNAGTNALGLSINAIEVNGTILQDGIPAGVNGFHLDFDPDAADDYSGGGTFTGNTAGTSKTPIDLANAFDGDITTYALHNSVEQVAANTDIVLNYTFPGTGVDVSNSLRVYVASYSHVSVNGGSTEYSYSVTSGGEWIDVSAAISGSNFKLTSLNIRRNIPATGNYRAALAAVEVDGKILVDGVAPGVDASGSKNHWTATNFVLQGAAGDPFTVYGNATNSGSSNPESVGNLSTLQSTSTTSYATGSTAYNHLTADFGSVGNWKIHADPFLSASTANITVYQSDNGTSWTSISIGQSPYSFSGRYIQWVRSGSGYGDQTLSAVNTYTEQDSLIDSPTNYEADSGNNGGNYATLNRLQTGSGVTLSNGNLDLDGTSSWKSSYSTIFLKSGKWYTEYTIRGITTHSYGIMVGLAGLGTNSIESEIGSSGDSYAIQNGPGDMKVNYNGTSSGQGPQAAYAVGDVLQLAWNADDGKLFFGKNGTWINSANPVTGANAIRNNLTGTYCFAVSLLTAADKISANFGQLPFRHTIPTGYKSVCTQNLDDSLISNGSTAFDVLTYSGSGYPDLTNPSQSLTGLSFSPDFVWAKARSAAYSHGLFDSVRGPNKGLRTNGTNTETNDSGNSSSLVSFDSNGFTVGPDAGAGTINYGGTNYVAWAWDGGNLATNSAYNQSQTWSASLSTNDTLQNPVNAFDGSTATRAQTANAGTGKTITFAPATDVSFATSLEVYCDQGNSTPTATWNGNTVNPGGGAWVTVYSGSGTINSSTPLVIDTETAGQYATLKGIRLDGKILVDAGVIPVGSANSSAYNSGEVWSTTGTLTVDLNGTTVSTMTGPLTKAFEGSLASSSMVYEGTPYTSGTKTYTYTFGTAQTNITSARVYLYQGNSAEGGATGFGNGTINKTQDGTYGWVDASSTIPSNGTVSAMTMTTTATSGVNSSRNGFIAIELNGKILLDNGVTPVDNFPSIASTVRANPTAGFSIVTYSVPSSGTTFSVGHGLEAAPSLIIAKDRGGTNPWGIYHSALGAGKGLLFTTAGEQVNSNWWNNTNPTSTLFYLNTGIYAHSQPGNDYVAYCFAPVAGYSAFGSYTGNGSANGTFVYTGFRPAFLMVKGNNNYDGGGTIVNGYNWFMYDSERSAYNLNDDLLAANKNFIEESNAGVDFLSNGFKMRNVNAPNANYTQYYIAFAENPFKIARAR